MKKLLLFCVFLTGCGGPLRHYEFAKGHCEGVNCKDTSAGDVTHSSEPGARVVVPKKKVR